MNARALIAVPLLVGMLSCYGPAVSDAVLCRDVIHRICQPPHCASVVTFMPEASCDAVVQARTGCNSDDFEFTTITRDRVLECRLPLVRSSNNTDAHPDCLDIDQSVNECTDLADFLKGVP